MDKTATGQAWPRQGEAIFLNLSGCPDVEILRTASLTSTDTTLPSNVRRILPRAFVNAAQQNGVKMESVKHGIERLNQE